MSALTSPEGDYQSARRALLTFAFVSHALDKSADLLMGLVPLFTPLISRLDKAVFDPKRISDDMFRFYGLSMNPLVIEEFVPRLEKAHLIKRGLDANEGVIYICTADQIKDTKPQNDISVTLDAVIESFKLYTNNLSPLAHFNYTDQQVEEILLNFLVTQYLPTPGAKQLI